MRETSPVKLQYNTPAHTKRKINKCNSRVWTWFLLYLLTLARSENKTIVLFCAGILLRYGQLFSITIPDQKRFMRYFPILYHFIVNYTLVISISEMPAGHARLERESWLVHTNWLLQQKDGPFSRFGGNFYIPVKQSQNNIWNLFFVPIFDCIDYYFWNCSKLQTRLKISILSGG